MNTINVPKIIPAGDLENIFTTLPEHAIDCCNWKKGKNHLLVPSEFSRNIVLAKIATKLALLLGSGTASKNCSIIILNRKSVINYLLYIFPNFFLCKAKYIGKCNDEG